jgi:hypothetical protein
MLIQGDSVRNLGPGRPAFLPTLKITSFYWWNLPKNNKN